MEACLMLTYGYLVYYGHPFCPGETVIHFLLRKSRLCGYSVNKANGLILKSQSA